MLSSLRGRAGASRPHVIAVGVRNGDAFLGSCHDYRFLVDGGSRVDNAQLISTAADNAQLPVSEFDVVICTHSDRDHANGVLGVLRAAAAQTLRVEELWLPADWLPVEDAAGTASLEALAARISEEMRRDSPSGLTYQRERVDPLAESGDEPDDIVREAEAFLADNPSLAFALAARFDARSVTEILATLSTVDLIRSIVSIGRSLADIVWWEYREDALTHRGSARPPFRGVNCVVQKVEQRSASTTTTARAPRPTMAWRSATARATSANSLLKAATITQTNARSLVFAWLPRDAPPALFTSDSRLNFPVAPLTRDGMLATAAHHGSPSNAATFAHVHAGLSDPSRVLWLRGSYKGTGSAQYPSREFTLQPRRACVERPCCGAARDVVARVGTSGWELADPTVSCPGFPLCRRP